MRRLLADRPSISRYLLLALGTVAATSALHCADRIDRHSATSCNARSVEIHFKLRAGWHHSMSVGEQPLLTTRHGAGLITGEADDPRDRWMRIEAPAGGAAMLARLQRDPAIEQAFVAPEVSLPQPIAPSQITDDGPSCPITTPSFESYQGYLGPAPQGIDAPAAWRRGVRGQGVWFADVEGGWNAKHEDLPGDRMTHAGGR